MVVNKKIVISKVIIIVVLIMAASGFFCWREIKETPPEDWLLAESSSPEDYIIKEAPEGNFVENKKAGLSFKIPEGWRIEKPLYLGVRLYSPDGVEWRTAFMQSGCRIIPNVTEITTSIETLEKELRKNNFLLSPSLDTYEIIKVANRKALKNVVEEKEKLNTYQVRIYIPTKDLFSENKLYSLELTTTPNDAGQCIQEFDKFLETILIK